MGKISSLEQSELGSYVGVSYVDSLGSAEDVATLLEVFEDASKKYNYSQFSGVVRDDKNYFYMVVGNGGFDLYGFIRDNYSGDCNISCVNANLLFPREMSRGVYVAPEEVESSVDSSYDSYDSYDSSGECYYEEDEDIATSYLDDSVPLDDVKHYKLYYKRMDTYVDVPDSGLVLGRSAKQADLVIKGNTNIGRAHSKVYISNGRLMVSDLNSLNGTFVNGIRVVNTNDVVLYPGDSLKLADEEFIVG